jgi:hypothetical protein
MIIRAITTNKGKTFDRYTVYFFDGTCLTLSSNPDSVQGVSQFGEYCGLNDEDFYQAAVHKQKLLESETMINFFDLPSVVQAHIEKRIKE